MGNLTALKDKLMGLYAPTTTSASSAAMPTSAWPLFRTDPSYQNKLDPATTLLSAAEMRTSLEVRRERLERELSAVLAAEQDLKVEGVDRMLDSLRKAHLI